ANDAGPVGDTLNVNDQGNTTGSTYTLTGSTVQRTPKALITYATIETLGLNAGSGADTINVLSTLATTGYTVNAGAGNDTINVGSAPEPPANSNLDGTVGPLTVNGQGNDATPTTPRSVACAGTTVTNTLPVGDTLNFNDQGSATAGTYALTATTFRRSAPATALLTYATVETVNLNTGTAGETINITSTAASANTTVNAGPGNDTITVTTTGMASNVQLNGQQGVDTITVQGSGPGSVTEVDGGAGNDTVSLQGNGTASGVRLSGGDGSDTLN